MLAAVPDLHSATIVLCIVTALAVVTACAYCLVRWWEARHPVEGKQPYAQRLQRRWNTKRVARGRAKALRRGGLNGP